MPMKPPWPIGVSTGASSLGRWSLCRSRSARGQRHREGELAMNMSYMSDCKLERKSRRTDYAAAARGYNERFPRRLIAEIVTAIAEARLCTDAYVMAIRM